MSNVMELSLRGASNLEKLMRAVLLDADNKIPAERLRIVGAVADGAIMESGSNANGYWCKLADGTLLMQGHYDVGSSAEPANIAITNQSGDHYYSSDLITFTLPYASYSEASGSLAVGHNPGWGGTESFWFWGGVVSGGSGQVRLYSSSSRTLYQVHFQWVFQGRWKA